MPVPFPLDAEAILPLIAKRWRYRRIAEHFGCSRAVIKMRAKKLRAEGHDFVSWRREPVIDGSKKCIRCEVSKDTTDFYKKTDERTSSWCKDCVRLGNKMRVYGLTEEAIGKLVVTDRCPLCLIEYTERCKPVIDHDHATGAVREVICFFCNHALGRISDRADTAMRMAEYLRKHGAAQCQ